MKTATIKWVWSLGLVGYSAAALAGEPRPASPQEPVGFVTGAVVGAFAAGPIGALVGAGLGTWLGNRVHKAKEATAAEARLAMLEAAPVSPAVQPAPEPPAIKPEPAALSDNSAALDGFQGDVMFRTGSAEITPEIAHQVQMLAQAVMKSATDARVLKVRVDGYADPRGSDAVNMKLSQDRAEAVLGLLLDAGVPAQVVEIHAYGKTQSVAQDLDGYALERRVRLTLQADDDSEVVKVGRNE